MVKVRISRFGLAIGLLILVLVGCLLYLVLSEEQQEGWQIGGNNLISDSSAGSDGTLYLLSNNYVNYNMISSRYYSLGCYDENASIYAVSKDGGVKWKHPLRELAQTENHSVEEYGAVFLATDEDGVYVLISDRYRNINETGAVSGSETKAAVTAISSSGSVKWIFPLGQTQGDYPMSGYGIRISTHYSRVYLYYNMSIYALDEDGSVAWRLDDVSSPAAVGPDGTVYVNKARWVKSQDQYESSYLTYSDTFEAYRQDGKRLWQRSLTLHQVSGAYELTLPIYRNGMLYVPLENGIMALDTGGQIKWTWQPDDQTDIHIYWTMPFDSDGNVYLYRGVPTSVYSPYNTYEFLAISPDGKLIKSYTDDDSKNVLERDGVIQYYTPDIPAESAKAVIPKTVESLYDLDTVTIKAYDAAEKADLWSVKLPVGNITTVTVTPENLKQLFPVRISSDIEMMNLFNHDYDNKLTPYHDVFNKTPVSVLSLKEASVLPVGDIIYVNLYTYAYETPTEYNKSRCAYASTLYAISRNGTLLWQKPMDRSIYWLAAGNNSTIYYSTTDGRVFTTAMYVAGGITAAAILYTIAHFFGAGTIARARSRLDANENRNAVYRFIAGNPGSTMRDIARGSGMNLGTIRYHLMILGLNHKIASYEADGKHMRYFVNSGAYTSEEQRVIAIVRREGMRKVLECLLQCSGKSNKDLSTLTGMRESAISRYTGELVSAGMVEKRVTPEGVMYSVSATLRNPVSNALALVSTKITADEAGLKTPGDPGT